MNAFSNIKWGRVVAGAALVTAAVGVCAFIVSSGGIAAGATGWLVSMIEGIAAAASNHTALTLGGAALVGGMGALATGGFADRVYDSAGKDLGLGKA